MKKTRLRRAVSLILALVMTLSMFSVSGFSGTASAAPEALPSSESNQASPAAQENFAVTPFNSASTDPTVTDARPKLYIDFLGDNAAGMTYIGSDGISTTVPSDLDQSYEQSSRPWRRYGYPSDPPTVCTPTVPGTVFWVGVGIDRMAMLELAKGGKGLSGLELGFYYNTTYVAPWTGSNDTAVGSNFAPDTTPGAYASVLGSYNLSSSPNPLNQWDSSAYEIVEAIPERNVEMDQLTQEINLTQEPTNSTMTGAEWRMLYVSLEKKSSDWNTGAGDWNTPNRFSSPDPADNSDINYVLMLPFVLKAYDDINPRWICFRLARNASAFSIGAEKLGAGNYDSDNTALSAFGAWERQTRTPKHNLKEMFTFEGDMNIFAGQNVKDTGFTATLVTVGQSTHVDNKAKIYPSYDPTIYVDTSGTSLSGLAPGDEVTLEASCGAGIVMSVAIASSSGSPISYTTVPPGGKYTFIMPASNVTVQVTYRSDGITPSDDYKVELIINGPAGIAENVATVTGTDDAGTTRTADLSVPLSIIPVKVGNTVDIDATHHPDYKMTIEVKTKAGVDVAWGPKLPVASNPDKYDFTMPEANVEVTVTYEKLPVHIAELSVDAVSDVDPGNMAKLSFKDYSASVTSPTTRYVDLNGQTGGRKELGPIPAERTVTLDIKLMEPTYMVSEIRLYNGDDSGNYGSTYIDLLSDPGLSFKTGDPDGYNYTLDITMPDNRIQVYVVFAKARNYTARLFLQDGKSAEMDGKYRVPDAPTGTLTNNSTDMTATPKQNKILVWPDETVTVHLQPAYGYEVVSVTFRWGGNTDVVTPTAGQTTVTHPMPAADMDVFVKFRSKDKYNATMVPSNLNGFVNNKTGWPKDTTATPVVFDYPTKYNIIEDDRSTGWIQVEPGWYIANIRVVGESTGNGYPLYSLSGNGYNNGAGGKVTLQVDQPAENILVYIDLRQGIPPVEPQYTLSLRVDDPDSDLPNPQLNNWAKASISGGAFQPDPAVKQRVDNGHVFTDINAGQMIEVTFGADAGYYVSSVTVTPAGYGVVPTWVAGNKVRFYQPAGSAVVTVHFAKRDPADPPYNAYLHITGANPGEVARLTNTASGLFTETDGAGVAAWSGDGFTTSVTTSRYVQVEVYRSGGGVVPWTGTNGNGSFVMPGSDVHVYVTFRDTPVDNDEHKLALTAVGPAGTLLGEAGKVDLEIAGTPEGTALSNDATVPTIRKDVRVGKDVRLTIQPNAGFEIDRIEYTPAGAASPVELTAPATPAGSRAVRFDMPACNTGVVVYFRRGGGNVNNRHTANIILRMEGYPTQVVDTTVVGDAQFHVTGGYSKEALAGTPLSAWAVARDGYYISKVEVTPKTLDTPGDLTGVFASQDIYTVMPDADCFINVYFKKGWPDEADLWVNLRVHGPNGVAGNNAQVYNVTQDTTTFAPSTAGGSQSLKSLVGNLMKVKINTAPGYRLQYPISVKDSAGTDIPYWWASDTEIRFYTPNTWVNVDVTFEPDDPSDPHVIKATLFNQTAGSTTKASLTQVNAPSATTGDLTSGMNSAITPLTTGEPLAVKIQDVPAGKVPTLWVQTANGVAVPYPALAEAGGVYTTTFPMQDEDVEVCVYDTDKPDPNASEYLATLVVTEYGANGSPNIANWAKMEDLAAVRSTGPVNVVGSASIKAIEDNTITINAMPITGYAVRSVVVTDELGVPVTLDKPTSTTPANEYTFTMPAKAVTAVVTFEKHDNTADPLTAQVVVDNAGNVGNTAVLRPYGTAAAGKTKLEGLAPGDKIEVDITVQSGYRIQVVKARATNGQVVGVTDLPYVPEMSQKVSFTMPSDDVVVFVRFVANAARHKITMYVTDNTTPTPNMTNYATLHTGFSGTRPNTRHGGVEVAEGSVGDTVTVTAYPDAGYYAIFAAYYEGTNTLVPAQTVDYTNKVFTFPVPNSNVRVEVNFYPDSVPKPKHTVRLHVTGPDPNVNVYAVALDTYVMDRGTSNRTDIPTSQMSLEVDYLNNVAVKSKAQTGYYVKYAYAMVGSTMLAPTPGTVSPNPLSTTDTYRDFDFKMQNADVDVYVAFTDVEPVGPYTAALTVHGPADTDWLGNPVIGAAGSAVLENTSQPNATGTVGSNKAFDPMTDTVSAAEDDMLKVTVTLNPGYSIDVVTVTPLNLNLYPTSITTKPNGQIEYVYKMPAANLAIDVRLKDDGIDRYKVTLHLSDACTNVPSDNMAKVSYTVYELTQDNAWMRVPDGQYVKVEAKAAPGYYIHHAYAVTEKGEIRPLLDVGHAPPPNPNIDPLQVIPGTGIHPNADDTAWFIMPAEDVDVYISFTTTPPKGRYSAILTLLDDDPTHRSKATMTLDRGGSDVQTITDDSNPGFAYVIGADAGETLSITLNIAQGYELDEIVLTGAIGVQPTIKGDGTQSGLNPPTKVSDTNYTFVMPSRDVGVVVKLKAVTVDGFKATLIIEDHSSALSNSVVMKELATTNTTVNTSGASITGLNGDEEIQTHVATASGVVIRGVFATDGTGTHLLSSNGTYYPYTMDRHDVTITVVLDNDDPGRTPEMYVAYVEKTGVEADDAANTAEVTNTSNPALPCGSIWTGIYGETPSQRLRVDVTTKSGFFATITATTVDGTGTTISVPVMQLGVAGVVTGYIDVPHQLWDNMRIEVNYSNTRIPGDHDLTLEMFGSAVGVGNTADVKEGVGASGLMSVGATALLDGPIQVTEGTGLTLETACAAGYYVVEAHLISNGISFVLDLEPNGKAGFRMPTDDAKVEVTLVQAQQTPRPHDNLQDPNFGGTKGNSTYLDGYLIGQTLGTNTGLIQIPNLYHKDLTPSTIIPAYDSPDAEYEFKLYLKAGGSYVELIPGVDYDVIADDSYDPGTVNATTGATAHSDTGWWMKIRSLKGESALTKLLLDGGVLYITATDVTDPMNPLGESQFVQVEFPADANRGKYQATLKIIDSSGVTGNTAEMSDGKVTVNTNGAIIKDLRGDELIRTQAKAATGARISAVTVTDSGGTRLLTEVPLGQDPHRFPHYMTGENIIITVYFEAEKDPPNPYSTRYIAAVSKYGAIAVPGNDASIKNGIRNNLLKGTIWAEGYVNDTMQVDIQVAAGYYATVKAYNKWTGDAVVVTAFGAGAPGFVAKFNMPAADVQVEVTWSRTPPADLKSDLILRLMGNYGTTADNLAKMADPPGSTTYALEVDATMVTPEDTETAVEAGKLFDLVTGHHVDYYIEKVVCRVYNATPATEFALPLDINGMYTGFAMPLGKTEVEVYIKKTDTDIRSPRPYDPLHSEDYNSPAYTYGSAEDLSSPTQAGWIMGMPLTPDASGRSRLQVVVPTLHDDGDPVPATALETAPAVSTSMKYKFYWKDGLNIYHELVEGTDIQITGVVKNNSYPGFDGYDMTLTALQSGNILEYYIKRGGMIYVTSNKAPTATPSQESDYTQVVVPRLYTATLHHKISGVPGTGATMTATGGTPASVTADGGEITALFGNETVTVKSIVSPPGYKLVGVVATTIQGSINVVKNPSNEFNYQMVNEDVDLYVVYDKDTDPLGDAYIATVYKVDDGGLAGNSATIKDVDVSIPDYQKGDIWTVAYNGNVVRVDVSTEPGWYAIITAKQAVSGANVPVVQFVAGSNSFYGLFYMPAAHVDVTVKYVHGPLPTYDLTLQMDPSGSFGGRPENNAQLTLEGGAGTLNVSGVSTSDVKNNVTPGLGMHLTTGTYTGFMVKEVRMTVDGNPVPPIHIPLTDGASLPDPNMPMGNTVVSVVFEVGEQTARPYDPAHANSYTATYNHYTPLDLSSTHQDGWILGQRRGDKRFTLTIPTLHNMRNSVVDPRGTLYHAGFAPDQPQYKLYWRDAMGVFWPLTDGTDIAITNEHIGSSYHDPISGNDYDNYVFDVDILPDTTNSADPTYPTLWGGYTLWQYLLNGGSIYVTATGGPSGNKESEKTEVVFPRTDTYTATIHYLWVDTTSGSPVTVTSSGTNMGVPSIPATVFSDGAYIDSLDGDEDVTVTTGTPSNASYKVAGVVATTVAGSVNVPLQSPMIPNVYKYVMDYMDVDLYVVYDRNDDPFEDKGPYIATVIKEDDGGLAGNTASIKDLDMVIPNYQKGDIWTAAYEDNVVRVDVSTEPGWYAVITAETIDGVAVSVAPFVVDSNNFYALFYMPDNHVNVTVKYINGPLPSYDLFLKTKDTAGVSGNKAQLTPDGMAGVTIDGLDTLMQVPSGGTPVQAGTELELLTGVASGYYVVSAQMEIATTPTAITVDIPIIDDAPQPNPVMPMANATVIVTFAPGNKTPRPYDPDHSDGYNPPYPDTANPDMSKTGQEGWILADVNSDSVTDRTFAIHVPTLHDNKGAAPGTLYNAGDSTPGNEEDRSKQPTYKLYWRDSMGAFHPLAEGTDYEVMVSPSDPSTKAEGFYTYSSVNYTSYTLAIHILPDPFNSTDPTYPTLWGGHTMLECLKKGGSLFITATGLDPNDRESEKTEVVFPAETAKVTLHIANHSSSPTPGTVKTTDNIKKAENDGEWFMTADDATIKTTVTANNGVVIRAVIATDSKGTRVLTKNASSEYIYTMQAEDVDITVVFDNDDPTDPDNPVVPDMYLAIVEKTGDDVELDDNTASITNMSNPALLHGEIWTGIYGETPKQRVKVDFTTATGYYAVVTARTTLSGGAVTLPVIQIGSTGTGLAYVDIPSTLDDNVIITVKYLRNAPTTQYNLSLEMVDPSADAGNTASINSSPVLNVSGTSLTAGPALVTGGSSLDLTTVVSAGFLKKVEIVSGGMRVELSTAAAPVPVVMPYADATVVVTLGKGERTPRPHDGVYDPSMGGAKVSADYIDGHLVGDNLGDNRALIRVPNLFSAALTPSCIPAFDEPDAKYQYKLYLNVGGSYVELVKGVDYDVTWESSYDPSGDAINTTTGVNPHSDTGWSYKIRSLKGESALTELMRDGGVLYITATDITDPANRLAESEYVEVHLDADPKGAAGYKATLRVVDNSGVAGNFAGMYLDGHTDVTYTGTGAILDAIQGSTDQLRGDEQVRTTAKAAAGARITAVTATTADGSTILLHEMPPHADPKRFPYYMIGEDVVITVYFEKEEDGDPSVVDDTRYIAAVAKYGAIDVVRNDATIANITPAPADRSSFGNGTIWQEALEDDEIQVTVTLAAGYYAEVTAVRMDDGSSYTVTINNPGPGPGDGTTAGDFTVDLTDFMPDSDVQINVVFTKELGGELRPYDPDNTGSANYADHWITSENQGDRLVVIVPMLNKEDGTDPTEVDKTAHAFHFHMAVNGAAPEDLDQILRLSHPDPEDTSGDPYENEIYYPEPPTPPATEPEKYHGARFVVEVLTDEEIDDAVTAGTITDGPGAKKLAALLRAIMDNAGTDTAITSGVDLDLDGNNVPENYKCNLYITHTDSTDAAFVCEKVDFEIPRYYSLTGKLESYAPAHIAKLSLEVYDTTDSEYKEPTYEYVEGVPYHLVVELSEKEIGSGLWRQDFAFKSSKLTGKKYQLVIEKAAHITYRRAEIELDPATAPVGRYDAAKLSFSFEKNIRLIAGDIDGSQTVKFDDWDYLLMFMYGWIDWTTAPDDTDPAKWEQSVFNPESLAYAADLTGDGRIDVDDEDVLMDRYNYNKTARSYRDSAGNEPTGLTLFSTMSTFSLMSFKATSYRVDNDVELLRDEETGEKNIPEWAAQLVRDGVRVPMWAVERLRDELNLPAWVVELIRQGKALPAWAAELVEAGETLPEKNEAPAVEDKDVDAGSEETGELPAKDADDKKAEEKPEVKPDDAKPEAKPVDKTEDTAKDEPSDTHKTGQTDEAEPDDKDSSVADEKEPEPAQDESETKDEAGKDTDHSDDQTKPETGTKPVDKTEQDSAAETPDGEEAAAETGKPEADDSSKTTTADDDHGKSQDAGAETKTETTSETKTEAKSETKTETESTRTDKVAETVKSADGADTVKTAETPAAVGETSVDNSCSQSEAPAAAEAAAE